MLQMARDDSAMKRERAMKTTHNLLSMYGITGVAGEYFVAAELSRRGWIGQIAQDINIYTIARNMSTSVQMIEQYYGKHGISPERARKLGGEVGEAQRPYDPIIRERRPARPPQRLQ
jgi:hypothetical protein